jgi:hypothetical protein
MIENVEIKEHFSSSDHNIITWNLNCVTVITTSNTIDYDYNRTDFALVNEDLQQVQWSDEFENLDANDMWVVFRDKLFSILNKFTPMRRRKNRKRPAWMTRAASRAQKYKCKMWKRYRQDKCYNNLIEYKKALNFATSVFKQAKKDFEVKLAGKIKTDSKSFYSYVRSKSKTKDKVGPLTDDKGTITTDNTAMCKILNEFFSSVFTDESLYPILPDIQEVFKEDHSKKLLDLGVTDNMVLNRLLKLKPNKAPGLDKLVPKILVEAASYVSKPLCMIFNRSINTGVVPVEWKQANISVIFKKGSRNLPSNYRPISLTSQVCKVLESLIKDKIVQHLTDFKLLKESQHGFIKNKSCLTNLLEYLLTVHDYVDKGVPVDVIYLDFQKAFDRVPHRRLLHKVRAHGIDGNVGRWIENWLSNRQQRVVLNGSLSEWKEVTSGVPQGSVLGPVLFLLYINDLDDSITSKLLKFADDAKLFRNVNNAQEVDKLREDLHRLCEWSSEWLMLFNYDKCKVMHFGYKNLAEDYSMDGKILQVTESERDLGVIIQKDLKVSQQCSKVVKTANSILGMINRSFTYKTKEIVIQLYKSLVRPHLDYCIQAWRPHLIKDINLLESIQHRVTRMIPGFRNLPYSERLHKLKLTTLETRRLRGDLIEVFKIMNGHEGLKVSQFFNFAESSLRGHSLKLFKTRFNTNIGKFTFCNRVVDEWNMLPEDVVSSNTVLNFKIKLDHFLKNGRGFI